MIDREQQRFGSARWSLDDDFNRAGLFGRDGLPVGYAGQRLLRLNSDSPGLIVAGAGSGKSRDCLIEMIIRMRKSPLWVLDPRGELAAVTLHIFAPAGVFVYCWNPAKLHPGILPSHRLNPLDILRENDPRFHADCGFIAAALIPLSGGNSQYFELRARQWVEALLKSIVERFGSASFPKLRDVLAMIESDPVAWDAHLTVMERSRHSDVRVCAGEMWKKQKDAPREFGAILGSIKAPLSFLNDPMLMASLDRPDFSLSDLTDAQTTSLFVNVPMEYVGLWSPLLRTIFTVSRLFKGRRPGARRLTMIVDEAGQMGHFEALLQAFTFGRGEGVRTLALFQDIGQIVRNFGAPTLQTFMGSAQLRTFFGVRDYQSAQLISNMLGDETLEYDDLRQQEAARRGQTDAFQRYAFGGDDSAALEFFHHSRASKLRSKMQRPLMTPDEILAMPEDRQITFMSGLNLHPAFLNRYPHYTLRDLNGLWMPNPFHPPFDRVKLPGMFGGKWAKVVSKAVPSKWAHFPQHRDGRVRTIQHYQLA